jgi:hypothetical protein
MVHKTQKAVNSLDGLHAGRGRLTLAENGAEGRRDSINSLNAAEGQDSIDRLNMAGVRRQKAQGGRSRRRTVQFAEPKTNRGDLQRRLEGLEASGGGDVEAVELELMFVGGDTTPTAAKKKPAAGWTNPRCG